MASQAETWKWNAQGSPAAARPDECAPAARGDALMAPTGHAPDTGAGGARRAAYALAHGGQARAADRPGARAAARPTAEVVARDRVGGAGVPGAGRRGAASGLRARQAH